MDYPKEFLGLPVVQNVLNAGKKTNLMPIADQAIEEMYALHSQAVACGTQLRWEARDIDMFCSWAATPQGGLFWRGAHNNLFPLQRHSAAAPLVNFTLPLPNYKQA